MSTPKKRSAKSKKTRKTSFVPRSILAAVSVASLVPICAVSCTAGSSTTNTDGGRQFTVAAMGYDGQALGVAAMGFDGSFSVANMSFDGSLSVANMSFDGSMDSGSSDGSEGG